MARRRHQMPEVEKRGRKKAYWSVRVWEDVRATSGVIERKRTRKFLGYCPTTNDPAQRRLRGEITKREADRLRNQLMERINSPALVTESQIPFLDFVEVWFDKYVSTLGAGTQQKYRSLARKHLLPDFRDVRLCDVNTEMLQAWLNSKPLSWWSKNSLRTMMGSLFGKARDWGYWQERSPVERVTAGRRRQARERRLLSPEETERLLRALPGFLELLIAFLRTTGCRISEALGLQWKHLDLASGWVRIEQRWYRGDLDVVKSERGRRELPLGELAEVFRALPRPDAQAFVFAGPDGKPMDDRTLLKDYLRPIARELGIHFPGLGFHSFRREVATRIQEAGATSAEAQLMLGHASENMTMVYTLPQKRRMQELVERMQETKGTVTTFPVSRKA